MLVPVTLPGPTGDRLAIVHYIGKEFRKLSDPAIRDDRQERNQPASVFEKFRGMMVIPDEPVRTTAEASQPTRMNLGIIIPALEKFGGAERFVIECVKHWQH